MWREMHNLPVQAVAAVWLPLSENSDFNKVLHKNTYSMGNILCLKFSQFCRNFDDI